MTKSKTAKISLSFSQPLNRDYYVTLSAKLNAS